MKDKDKTKEPLTNELEEMRHGITELEASEAERKQAEKVLRESEERYRTVIQDAHDMIQSVRLDGSFVFVNPAWLQTLGYTEKDVPGLNIFNIIHPESIAHCQEMFAKVMRGESVQNLSAIFVARDGRKVLVDGNASPRYMGNKVVATHGIFRDVTERKKAEEALRRSEENYQDLYNNAPIAYLSVDTAGYVVQANRAVCNWLGYSTNELVGKHRDIIYAEECLSEARRIFERFKQGKPTEDKEMVYRTKGGQKVYGLLSVSPITDESGKIIATRSVIKDITQRKRAEKALIKAEENFRNSIDNSPFGIRIITPKGKTLYANKALLDIYGYENMGELIKTPSIERYTPESYSEHQARKAKRKLGESLPESYTIDIIRKDGAVRNLEVFRKEVNWDGKPQTQILYQDVTDRVRAQEEFRQSDMKYATLVEHSNDGIVILREGLLKYANTRMFNTLGFRSEEALEKPFTDFVAPADREIVAENYRRRMAGEYVPNKYELMLIAKDGREIPTEISASIIEYEGKPSDMAIIRDISERKQAEEMLRQSEEKFRLIAETSPDYIVRTDSQGKIVYASPAVKRMLGYDPEELEGKDYVDLVPTSTLSITQPILRRVSKGEVLQNLEVELLHKDGKVIPVEVSLAPIIERNKIAGFLAISRDISERKQVEAERTKLEQKAQLSSRLASVGEMASGVAHEINNPLTSVIGFSELLMEKDLPEDLREDVEIIHDGSQRVAGIVKRLLTFARQHKPERTYTDINEIIESTLALRKYSLETGNIEVNALLEPELPWTVADAGQLQQVFMNIIVNAESEMKKAHGRGKLIIKTEQIGNTIRISFKDDGSGIAKKNLEKVFDPFFTTKGVGEGTGLGLSLSYGIIAEHSGAMYAESEAGKGATFIIELPVVSEESQLALAEEEAEEPEKVIGAKILIVDDELGVCKFLSRLLSKEGYNVETTDNAGDALQKIEQERYNLILMDIKMPEMSGIELYQRIRKTTRSLAKRMVFITGDVMAADTESFLSRSKASYISKPFNAKQLKKEIARILRGQS